MLHLKGKYLHNWLSINLFKPYKSYILLLWYLCICVHPMLFSLTQYFIYNTKGHITKRVHCKYICLYVICEK
ncbi:hypothetical protein XENTR_v10005447 [Xenopus tropicalis]|nr:hypothetical protein XENTR_v10005447 [Xenopus tropicalis]